MNISTLSYKLNFNPPNWIVLSAATVQLQPYSHSDRSSNHYSPVGRTAPVMLAFGGTVEAAGDSSSDDGEVSGNTKRRFRTKFSGEQKGKMMEFAKELGWKIQKHDEQQVHKFCTEIGIKRQNFKVWMHNNKQPMKNNSSEG